MFKDKNTYKNSFFIVIVILILVQLFVAGIFLISLRGSQKQLEAKIVNIENNLNKFANETQSALSFIRSQILRQQATNGSRYNTTNSNIDNNQINN